MHSCRRIQCHKFGCCFAGCRRVGRVAAPKVLQGYTEDRRRAKGVLCPLVKSGSVENWKSCLVRERGGFRDVDADVVSIFVQKLGALLLTLVRYLLNIEELLLRAEGTFVGS